MGCNMSCPFSHWIYSELQCYAWWHNIQFLLFFFHGNVWHHFNNNKTLGEWVFMWLLHVYLILVENILLFTHSQKLLTTGVYWKRKDKFLLRVWFLVRLPWSRGWLIPRNLWHTQIKLGQVSKLSFWMKRNTRKRYIETEWWNQRRYIWPSSSWRKRNVLTDENWNQILKPWPLNNPEVSSPTYQVNDKCTGTSRGPFRERHQ